ncbi:hypothetical protein E1262_04600 [Jiangella aurantiaca]|uniref:AMIN-like domain-containing protein n=1 Tax=Jiangella aurantiaca TaxID=2530373 RepID=A0A4R5AKN8_9ACTN|nr:hypothetical protein [Jiangella aurantiaca]TDD71999.1 hypothetical protein E1262_04600 [Jiangella aurantiaca]
MRRTIAVLIALLAAVLAYTVAPTASAAPYCGIRWGSLPERAAATDTAPLVDVRAGRHTCFDRLVLDFAGDADGYSVRYVSAVRMDGSGQLVPLRGGAYLEVVAIAPAYDDAGRSTYRPANPRELVSVSGWRTFRQVAWAGSFEGQTTIGLGVRARLPFRAFTLDGPGDGSRLVIDVAHRW